MGQKSRQKRDRRREESAESKAFRAHMELEDRSERIERVLRRCGFDPKKLDFFALIKVCTMSGYMITLAGEWLPRLRPLPGVEYNRWFDELVIAPGITKFVRPSMPPAGIPDGARRLGPNIRVPDTDPFDLVEVRSLGCGLRAREVVTVEERGPRPWSISDFAREPNRG